MQLNRCQSPEAKALLSHPCGAWLLLFPGFVAALAKGITIACERRRARKQNQPSAAARINQCFLKITLEVPKGKFSQPSRVEPAFNMPGGGVERTATGNIPVAIKRV